MKIKIDPIFPVLFILMFFLGYVSEYVMILISIILHEFGHIAVSLSYGWQVDTVTILPVGLKASVIECGCSRIKKVLIYLSGPLMNLCIFGTGMYLWNIGIGDKKTFETLILSNIYLLIFNMLPVLPLDGGKILREVLSSFFGVFKADIVTKRVSLLFASVIIFFGVFQFIENPKNFSLIAVGIYILYAWRTENTEAALMSMRNLLYRHKRFQKKGVYPARGLAALKQTKLGQVFKNIDYDSFHFIYVLDNDLSILKIFSEKEIMDAMVSYNADISFEELIKKNRKL